MGRSHCLHLMFSIPSLLVAADNTILLQLDDQPATCLAEPAFSQPCQRLKWPMTRAILNLLRLCAVRCETAHD